MIVVKCEAPPQCKFTVNVPVWRGMKLTETISCWYEGGGGGGCGCVTDQMHWWRTLRMPSLHKPLPLTLTTGGRGQQVLPTATDDNETSESGADRENAIITVSVGTLLTGTHPAIWRRAVYLPDAALFVVLTRLAPSRNKIEAHSAVVTDLLFEDPLQCTGSLDYKLTVPDITQHL